MIFYDCSTAPSPRRARMFIAEKGIRIETHNIDMRKNEQQSPEFLAVNPSATLPALITAGGIVLSENIAIATYLEEVCSAVPLMGVGPEEKAVVMMWNAICEFQGGMAIAEALRNAHPAMKGRALPGPHDYAQIPELAARGMQRIDAFFDTLEMRLSQTAWLGGAQFTFADITGFVFCDFARVVKKRPTEAHPKTKEWFSRMQGRPSAAL